MNLCWSKAGFELSSLLCDNPGRMGGTSMYKRVLIMLFCVLALSLSTLAAPKPKKTAASGAPDKAYLQKLLDGWSAGNAGAMTITDCLRPQRIAASSGPMWPRSSRRNTT
jgi:hypothetical protein